MRERNILLVYAGPLVVIYVWLLPVGQRSYTLLLSIQLGRPPLQ